MARVPDADPERLEPAVKAVLDAQTKQWGAPLLNHRVYARRPTISWPRSHSWPAPSTTTTRVKTLRFGGSGAKTPQLEEIPAAPR